MGVKEREKRWGGAPERGRARKNEIERGSERE